MRLLTRQGLRCKAGPNKQGCKDPELGESQLTSQLVGFSPIIAHVQPYHALAGRRPTHTAWYQPPILAYFDDLAWEALMGSLMQAHKP
jgi:hypothetical protein